MSLSLTCIGILFLLKLSENVGETCRENTRFNQQGEIALIAELPLAKPVEKGVVEFFFSVSSVKKGESCAIVPPCIVCFVVGLHGLLCKTLSLSNYQQTQTPKNKQNKLTKKKKQTQTPYACSAPELKAIIVERLWNGSVRDTWKENIKSELKKNK